MEVQLSVFTGSSNVREDAGRTMSILVLSPFRPVLVQPGSGVKSCGGNVIEMGNHKENL